VVTAALRRGYGTTGGAYYEGNQPCTTDNYIRAGRESTRDLAAVIEYATALPYVRPGGVVLVGQSSGGWATLAFNSAPHPTVTAVVSMAGGRGGHYHNAPNSNCAPENLEAATGVLGRSAETPMLWVYTQNDSFFAPPIAQAMHAAYTGAGGKAELDQLGPFAADGHTLFFGRGGPATWGPLIERYLQQRGAL
jgi:dienelactone hydrolase